MTFIFTFLGREWRFDLVLLYRSVREKRIRHAKERFEDTRKKFDNHGGNIIYILILFKMWKHFQILEFLCIEYNIRMEFWKIDQTPRIDLLVNYFPVILISYRNRKGIIEVIPIFSILQPEAFAELNFCLQIPSGVRLFVFFFFSTK